jgi:hypothetical protein
MIALPAAAQKKVYVDYDRNADFDSYKTFAWGPTLETSLKDESAFVHFLIKNAIEYRLSVGGMTENTEDPDVYVTYHGGSQEQVQVMVTSFGYSYGPGWYWDPFWGGSIVTTGVQATTFEKGSLVIDLWDARTEQAIWRGTATATVPEDPEKMAKTVDKAIDKMVKKFRKMRAKE